MANSLKRDLWYDRHTRCWVAQLKDADGNQATMKPAESEEDFISKSNPV